MAPSAQRARSPRPKPARRIRVVAPMAGGMAIVCITVGSEEPGYYRVETAPSDFGRAFRVVKLELSADGPNGFQCREGEAYDVCLDTAGTAHQCACKGWLRWNNCKHVYGLLALLERGKV